jgi:hypothetical protein
MYRVNEGMYFLSVLRKAVSKLSVYSRFCISLRSNFGLVIFCPQQKQHQERYERIAPLFLHILTLGVGKNGDRILSLSNTKKHLMIS